MLNALCCRLDDCKHGASVTFNASFGTIINRRFKTHLVVFEAIRIANALLFVPPLRIDCYFNTNLFNIFC